MPSLGCSPDIRYASIADLSLIFVASASMEFYTSSFIQKQVFYHFYCCNLFAVFSSGL
jgi:hypothetical protein